MQNSSENSQSNENVKHYLGLRKDGEFDFMAPPKTSVTNRAGKLTKRFGKYETGVKGLKSDLAKLIEFTDNNDIGSAVELDALALANQPISQCNRDCYKLIFEFISVFFK